MLKLIRRPFMQAVETPCIFLNEGLISMDYEIDIAHQTIIGEKTTSEVFSLLAKKELLKVDEIGHLYHIKVKEDIYKNSDSNIRYVEELSILHHNLVVYTNSTGQITDVVNRRAIKEEWETISPKLYSKYKKDPNTIKYVTNVQQMLSDKDHFLEYIRNHSLIKALFPDIYHLEVGKQLVKTSNVREPGTGIEMPIFMIGTPTLDEKRSTIEILQIGKLDKERFDGQPLTRTLRKIYEIPHLPVEIDLNVFETCELDTSFKMLEKTRCQEIQIGPEYLHRHVIKTSLRKTEL
ncbi:hypothetical protein ACFQ1M_16115 [Sungkyunkwania multivorans]|uniref:Uncharacterized protein n=1 Tax=Sungkyunkwania multivorans TaxID=1173618 RepID=A0ABW3D1P7_9FLAO